LLRDPRGAGGASPIEVTDLIDPPAPLELSRPKPSTLRKPDEPEMSPEKPQDRERPDRRTG
jgi:hypothetical protein